jgi:fumarylacetoacetase
MQTASLHLPVHIGDYTDFYSSEYHAANVGAMFRDPQNPLLPNWKHIPVGYHGRSSSIVVSGTDFHRPYGQFKAPAEELPSFGAAKQVDMELETAFIISRNTPLGSRIGVDEAEDSIFGMLLFNDWSARDLQSWEYVPLGPFLGKNFCSSVSPWVVSMEALKPFRVHMPEKQEPEVLPYLKQKNRWTYDIQLEAEFCTAEGQKKTITRTNQKYLYWSMNQQLAHHTINGCPMRTGDLLASGTISGPDADSLGCLLEITRRGQNPVHFEGGLQRNFMQDGDRITLRGFAEKNGIRVGFGEVTGKLLPALAF